jgi:hypothetical protein
MRKVLNLAVTVVVGYVLLCIVVALLQRRLLYFPAQMTAQEASLVASDEGLEPWHVEDTLVGYKRSKPEARARLVVFHGNAGSALDRSFYADAFGRLDGGKGFEVYLFEYPGYGSREGKPSKEAFVSAATSAVDALLAADRRPLYVLGESIGSGVAAALVSARPAISGAVMMIPFARLAEVASTRFPFLPVRLLLRDDFDNRKALAGYSGRVAVVVASRDDVIGPGPGHSLYESYRGTKKLIELEGATHTFFPAEPGAAWYADVTSFLLERAP